MILGRHRELIAEYNKLKKLLSANLVIDEELRKTFPRRIKVDISYEDSIYSWDKEIKVKVDITPENHRLNEKELFILYDWLSKYGRWDEELSYSGEITQKVTTTIKKILVEITVIGRNSNFCKVERSNLRKERSYSYNRKADYQLVCQ